MLLHFMDIAMTNAYILHWDKQIKAHKAYDT